jgi:molecular chaperone GrpE
MTRKKNVNEEVKPDKDADIDSEKESEGEQAETGNAAEADDTKETDSSEDAKEEAKSKEEESFETKYLRMAADFQNFKRRTEEEKARIYANANEKFGMDLLEVLDNFERAIEQGRKDEEGSQFLKGMEMILKQLQNVLKKNGIEEIEALGQEFDPNFHHAVAMESSDKYDKGCVTDVMQKGYKLKDRIIRPCMVRVAE